MRTFRVSFDVKGEDRLGTILAVCLGSQGYAGNLKVEEGDPTSKVGPTRRAKGAGPTPEQRKEWALRHWPVIKEAMGNKELNYKAIGLTVQKATGNFKVTSISPLLSELARAGMVERTGRGMYRAK